MNDRDELISLLQQLGPTANNQFFQTASPDPQAVDNALLFIKTVGAYPNHAFNSTWTVTLSYLSKTSVPIPDSPNYTDGETFTAIVGNTYCIPPGQAVLSGEIWNQTSETITWSSNDSTTIISQCQAFLVG